MEYNSRTKLTVLAHELLDAWRSDQVGREFVERADAIYTLLHWLHPQEPSGEDEDRETDIVAIFRRLGQVETNYRIKFPELTERVDSHTRRIEEDHLYAAEQIVNLGNRATKEHERVGNLWEEMKRDHHVVARLKEAFRGHDQQLATLEDALALALTPAPKPEPACEHLCTERIVRSVMGGRVAIAACAESRCPAIRVDSRWYIPQSPSETDDGEGKPG